MVSLSNYYYSHKDEYLGALFESRKRGHDLTPFLQFALPAVTERCNSVAGEILVNHKRVLFREFARSLFGQLRSPRRRVLVERQLQVLETLLDSDSVGGVDLIRRTETYYRDLKYPDRAYVRDVIELYDLGALEFRDGISGLTWIGHSSFPSRNYWNGMKTCRPPYPLIIRRCRSCHGCWAAGVNHRASRPCCLPLSRRVVFVIEGQSFPGCVLCVW